MTMQLEEGVHSDPLPDLFSPGFGGISLGKTFMTLPWVLFMACGFGG